MRDTLYTARKKRVAVEGGIPLSGGFYERLCQRA